PLGSEQSASEAALIRQVVSDEVGWFTASEVRFGSTYPIDYPPDGVNIINDPLRPLMQIMSASDIDDHTRVVDGRLAKGTSDPSQLEVMVPSEAARIFKLKPGDKIVGLVVFDDCVRLPPTNDPEEIA